MAVWLRAKLRAVAAELFGGLSRVRGRRRACSQCTVSVVTAAKHRYLDRHPWLLITAAAATGVHCCALPCPGQGVLHSI